MSNKTQKAANEVNGLSLPIAAMLAVGVLSAIIVGFSFEVIKVWPLPPSVEPYFGFEIGWIWGACVGAVVGFILGFLTDDRHFEERLPEDSSN